MKANRFFTCTYNMCIYKFNTYICIYCLWNLLATSSLKVTFLENGTLETEEFVSVNVMVQTPYNVRLCISIYRNKMKIYHFLQ